MSYEIIDADTLFGFSPRQKLDVSSAQLQKMMHQNKISRAITYSLQGIHYDYRLGNQETIDLCQTNPEFIPAFSVDPRQYFGCIDEIKLRAKQGCKLVRLFPEIQGWHFDAAPVTKILKSIAEYQLVLMVETRPWGAATKVVEYTKQFDIPVILLNVSYFTMGEPIELVKTVKNVYLEPRLMNGPDGIDLVVKECGASCMIFGSHAPFDDIEPAVMVVEGSHISQEEKQLIFSGNIKRLLNIK
jgi:predicted TIM-barrel fold metal-dependent hydrolase